MQTSGHTKIDVKFKTVETRAKHKSFVFFGGEKRVRLHIRDRLDR